MLTFDGSVLVTLINIYRRAVMKNVIAAVAILAATGATAQDSIDSSVLDNNSQVESQMQLLSQLVEDEAATREYKFISVEDAPRLKPKSFSLFEMDLGNGARDIADSAGMHIGNTVEGIANFSSEAIGAGRDFVGGALTNVGKFISR